jgi:organic hydroperoxide reductase OsmC/OhrA
MKIGQEADAMSTFSVAVNWALGAGELAHGKYSPDHTVSFGGERLSMSSAPDFGGNAALANPEQAVTAALASCHMLTFLALAAKARWKVVTYTDSPQARLGKTADGRTRVEAIALKPVVAFAGDPPAAHALAEMHEKAHRYCFIANTLSCDMTVAPAIA